MASHPDGVDDGFDLDDLPQPLRARFEALLEGGRLEVRRDGSTVATLEAVPTVLEGVLLPPQAQRTPPPPTPEGAAVVVTASKLSERARAVLAEALGRDYVVIDMLSAPETADVVLTHPVSPKLIQAFARMFPRARIIVTEMDDPELNVHYTGNVARLLDAGAEAYLPPRSLSQTGADMRQLLGSGHPELGARPRATGQLPAADAGGPPEPSGTIESPRSASFGDDPA
ncbi:hypothetical protein ACMYYO_02605 [Dermacoccaceae bacterium W4C1]